MEAMRKDKERFVAFSFAAADLLLELDAEGMVCFASGAAKGLTGIETPKLKGQIFTDLIGEFDRDVIKQILTSMKEGDRIPPVSAKMDLTGISCVIGACKLPRNHDHIFLALNVSVMPAVRTVVEYRDQETGLLDRNDFFKIAEEKVGTSAETGQRAELTLLRLTDLTGMQSRINEEDMTAFMQNVGMLLRRYSLGGDSAGRLDADKYGIVHSPTVNGDVIREKVGALAKKADPKGNGSIQANTIDLSQGQLSAAHATQALMYVINRFVESDGQDFNISSLTEGMETRLETAMTRMIALKSVFQNYKFRLVYQPIVNVTDKEIHHYEVLSRFRDGESPYETVTFAEETGIIHDLDLGVAKKVKDKLIEIQKRGDILPMLSFNISGHSLESDSFMDNLLAMFQDNDEVREHINLEITETARVKDLERADQVLQTFRKAGVKISLDDMGSGSASFQYIRALTVDYIKIDGLYMKEVLTNKKDAAILKAMSRLCQELNIGTVAEMVETKEQLHVLNVLGINYGQGWYFGKPQPDIETKRKNRGISLNIKRKGFQTTWS
ncbi:MAG: EAL domain-containing protein [Alphaproteobacteria bacterium]|nr:MAG: EAL domain-containing protein [Alphaproteobacteria bacterium]